LHLSLILPHFDSFHFLCCFLGLLLGAYRHLSKAGKLHWLTH